MKFLHLVIAFLLLGAVGVSAELSPLEKEPSELTSADYLKALRSRRQGSTCGIFTGTVQHQRRGGEAFTLPIRFAVLLAPARTTGQVIIGKSGFLIGQEIKTDNAVSTVVPMAGSAELDLAGYVGVRASDLAMGFVFWKFVKEMPKERVGLIPCRVFLMESPDGAETVKIFCATKYFFPLRAAFYAKGNAEKKDAAPVRLVEVSAFSEKNELFFARSLRFSGPGWRTRIEFSQRDAVVEPYAADNPRKLFLPSLTQAGSQP